AFGGPEHGADLRQLALLQHGAAEQLHRPFPALAQDVRSRRRITGEPSARVRPVIAAAPSRPRARPALRSARGSTMGKKNGGRRPVARRPSSANAPSTSRSRKTVNGRVSPSTPRLAPNSRPEMALT